MTWEFRVIREIYNNQEIVEIKEVYYDDNMKITAIGDAPVPYGETLEELKAIIDDMNKASEKPVLDMPLFEDSQVYCTNCKNGIKLVNSLNTDTDLPLECNGCNSYDLEDSKPYKERCNYKLK